MQMAEKYLNEFGFRKRRNSNKHDTQSVASSELAEKVEITRSIVEQSTIIMNDITSLALDEIIGKRRRKRSKYGW